MDYATEPTAEDVVIYSIDELDDDVERRTVNATDVDANNNYFYSHAYTMYDSESAPDASVAVKLAINPAGSTDAPDGPTCGPDPPPAPSCEPDNSADHIEGYELKFGTRVSTE
jgi:hypothetical protein